MGRIMKWSARSDHLGGIPRKTVIMVVGVFARAVANLCNKTTVHNADTLMTLVRSRPPGVPLITLHTFPEGKVFQQDVPIRQLTWGITSLIARCSVSPIVLPIIHRDFEEMMPEKYLYGRRPPLPLWNKNLQVVVGEPIEFDVPMMAETVVSASHHVTTPLQKVKWLVLSSAGKELNETA